MTLRVWIYMRVSTLEQAKEWFWLDSQERILKSYIEANKDNDWELWKNLVYCDEWISGASNVEDRPALNRLKKDIIDWKLDILLVWKIDRLFRKTRYLLEFIEFIKKYNINFISKNENIDLKTHTWNLVITMIWAIAEMERASIQERTTEGRISKALQGFFVYWSAPFWYKKVIEWKWYKLRVNEEEVETVKKIFDMYVNEDKTTSFIRRYLTSLNIWTRADKENKPKLSRNYFHYSFVHKILSNETYIWKYYFRKSKNINENWKTKEVKRDKSEWLYFECDKILDERIFAKAQEKLKNWKVMNWRGKSHLFTGLLKCDECWRSYVHYETKKDTSSYICNWRGKSKVWDDILCTNSEISELKLLDIIWNRVSKAFTNPDRFIQTYIDWKDDQTEIINSYRKELLTIENNINLKNKIIKKWIKKQLEDEENYTLYDEIILETTKEKKELESRSLYLEDKLTDLKTIDEIKEMIFNISKIYKKNYEKLSIEEKKLIIRELIKSIAIWKENITIVYRFNV